MRLTLEPFSIFHVFFRNMKNGSRGRILMIFGAILDTSGATLGSIWAPWVAKVDPSEEFVFQ